MVRFLYFTWTGKMLTPIDFDKLCIHTHNVIPTATTKEVAQRDIFKNTTEKNKMKF